MGCYQPVSYTHLAIAIKKGCKTAAEAAAAIGEGLQSFCIPGSVADQRKVGLGHGNLGKMLLEEDKMCIRDRLWGGRFTKETDKLVYNFNASIGFDQKFFHQDVQMYRYSFGSAFYDHSSMENVTITSSWPRASSHPDVARRVARR